MSGDCGDCKAASLTLWHGFRTDCSGCKARAIGRSARFFESVRGGGQTRAYRNALAFVNVTHDDVVVAVSSDVEMKDKLPEFMR